MNRRHFIQSAASAGIAAAPAAAAGGRNAIFELRYFRLRNGSQTRQTTQFLSKYYLPSARRAGAGPFGFFNAVIAQQSPFTLALVSYPSLNAVGEVHEKMMDDKEFRKGFDEYNSMSELSYIRMENSLLRAFDGVPSILVPPSDAKREPRIFEMRTYESNNVKASLRKIKMFNDGEIQIFKRLGMQPVFFGETIVGRNLPNLTYMLSFNDLAAREKLWKVFGSDPEWQKIRSVPDVADAQIVSNISNAILRPLPFSDIK